MSASRIQTKTNGTGAASTTNALTLNSSPVNGNGLIAFIYLDGNANSVSSITQTGATWIRLAQKQSTNSAKTLEIWGAFNVSGASTSVTVNLSASTRSAVIVAEYSGLLTASVLDKTATNDGASTGSAWSTGTTVTTTQASELYVAAWGWASDNSVGALTFSSLTSGFSVVDTASSTNSSGGSPRAMRGVTYAESIVNATSAATCSATPSTASAFASAIVTLKATAAAANQQLLMLMGSG